MTEVGKPQPDIASARRAARAYWDAHPISTDDVPYEAGTPESFEAIYSRWLEGVNQARRAFVEACRDKKVLEVGCGIALDGRFLSENGIDYQAVDYSLRSLTLAQKHFGLNGLTPRFSNADATQLPFADGAFGLVYSIGVLHHVPDMARACREVVRVVEPGGSVRVMFYNRHSYHYLLVHYCVRPLVWLLLQLPFGDALARRLPAKLRLTYEICRDHGFDAQRILNVSTDTSFTGANDFNPLSHFVTERELVDLFGGLEERKFGRSDLKYFPLPFLREAVEKRWGFFLRMTAKKPAAEVSPSSGTK